MTSDDQIAERSAAVGGQASNTGRSAGSARSVTTLVALSWFVVFGSRLVLPALAIQIQGTLGIGNASFGLAVSVLWVCYSVMQFPSGILADELGYRTVLVGGCVLMTAGSVAIVGARTFPWFVVAAGLLGVGTGLLTTPSLSLVSDLYGDRKGGALGIVNAAGDASGVVAPVAATAVLLVATWQSMFLALSLAGAVLAGAFHLVLAGEYSIELPRVVSNVRGSGHKMLRSGVPVLLLTYGVYAFVWQALSAFIPLYLYEAKSLPQSEGNALLALFFLAGMVVKPVAGWLSDEVSRRCIASASMLVAGTALFALTTAAADRLAVVLTIGLFGMALMAFPPVMQSYLMDLFEGEQMSGAFGFSRTLFILFGSLGPVAVGVGSEIASYTAVFVLLSGSLIVFAGVLFVTMGSLGGD